MASTVDLDTLFKSVKQQLLEKKEPLNEADDYNHDHGDNMVQIFKLIQNAVAEKSDAPVEKQLAYASEIVGKEANSGSSKLYAQGLSNAAAKFSDKDLTKDTLGVLLQSLLGAEQPEQKPQPQNDNILGSLLSGLTGQSESQPKPQGQSEGDLLGSLLSSMTGQSDSTETQSPQPQSGDLLGSLLSSLAGGSSGNTQADQSLGLDDLITAGMAFFQSKQNGESSMEAILDALMAASPMGKSSHRSQSASIVASTIMNFAANMKK